MLKDIFKSGNTEFIPGAHTELRAQLSRNRKVVSVKGNLMANTRTDISGVSARVYKNGVYGFSSLPELGTDAAKTVLKEASNNADFLGSHAGSDFTELPKLEKENVNECYEIDNADQKLYIDFVRELDSYVESHYKGLTSRMVVAVEDSMEKLLLTSDGVDAHTIIPRSYVYVFMNAETKDGVPVELFTVPGGEGVFGHNFTDIKEIIPYLDTNYERLMQKREGVYADAGEKTVILGGMMSGMLAHEAVGHTVEADIVLAGSVASKMLGERVASDLISLTDFAHTAFGKRAPLPVFADDEGTKAVDVNLIENGILTGYMNSRKTAQHFGMQPGGNARGFIFSDEPLIRMRNTSIHPGNDKLEDMIASIDDGYYLVHSTNGEADVTGEFMFGVSMGYEIKNGKLGRALLDTTVSGIAFDMLKTVDMVGDEITWSSSGYCGKKQYMPVAMGGPAIKCKITIGGR